MSIEDIKSPLPPRKTPPVETDELTERVTLSEPVVQSETSERKEPEVPLPPKRNFKKPLIFGAIGLGVILLLLLTIKIVLPKFGGSSGPITINYWGLWEDQAIMAGVIADFEAKNPGIKVNYKMNQKNDYRTRLLGRLGKTDQEVDVPDIFRIHNTWIPMFKEHLAPVPENTSKTLELESDFFDTYKTSLKLNNQFVTIPLMYDGLALFYNKDLIESGQVSLPKSWWDLKSAATKLTVKDNDGKIKLAIEVPV